MQRRLKERLDSAILASQTCWPPHRKPCSPPVDTQATASPSSGHAELFRRGNVGGDSQGLHSPAQVAVAAGLDEVGTRDIGS
jgi:hypothetical protein